MHEYIHMPDIYAHTQRIHFPMLQGWSSVIYRLHCRFQVVTHHIDTDSNLNLGLVFPGCFLDSFVLHIFSCSPAPNCKYSNLLSPVLICINNTYIWSMFILSRSNSPVVSSVCRPCMVSLKVRSKREKQKMMMQFWKKKKKIKKKTNVRREGRKRER